MGTDERDVNSFERLLIEMQEIRSKVRERQCYICTRIPIILCEVC